MEGQADGKEMDRKSRLHVGGGSWCGLKGAGAEEEVYAGFVDGGGGRMDRQASELVEVGRGAWRYDQRHGHRRRTSGLRSSRGIDHGVAGQGGAPEQGRLAAQQKDPDAGTERRSDAQVKNSTIA